MGAAEQRKTIYLPRALAKFRQGFGRLMRKESDKGCVFVLDRRVLDPRHRGFLDELPLANAFEHDRELESTPRRAELVQGDGARCLRAAFTHMGLDAALEERGLARGFEGWRLHPEDGRDSLGSSEG
jgi:hypothetical protein